MNLFFQRLSLIVLLSISLQSKLFAQGQGDELILENSSQDITIVMGTCAGGAILGLSTLSFVDDYQDHLKRVVAGGALGVIVGVGIVGYISANKSKSLYYEGAEGAEAHINRPNFQTTSRISYHLEQNTFKSSSPKLNNTLAQFSFSF